MKTAAQPAETADTFELVPQILPLKKILVPIDFSPLSKTAFRYAARFAKRFGCQIVLLHVVEPMTATSVVRTGHAPNEITKAAKELDVDLIMIASHGYTSWRHLCIGSTAERVVRAAPCSVLVVREKEHDFV